MATIAHAGNALRARRDECPNLKGFGNGQIKVWRPIVVRLDEEVHQGWIGAGPADHVLYYEDSGAWFKINLAKAEIPTPEEEISFTRRAAEEPQSKEEKNAKRQARRRARRAAAHIEGDEDEEDDE